MADITKCKGIGCPLKEECYRFIATPNDFRQSYFDFIPYHHKRNECDFYIIR